VALRRRKNDRRTGIVALLVALMLTVLLGVVALAADGGLLLVDRRNAQAAADTAALSAAADLFSNWTTNAAHGFDNGGTAKSCALAVASANGYNNDGTTSIVTVNVPGGTYSGGPKAGQTIPAGYVEVIVQYNRTRIFSSIFGSTPLSVQARSVARAQWIFAPPVVVLDRSADGALLLGGNGVVSVPYGPVFDNSSSGIALQVSAAGSMLAPQYNVTGNATPGFNYYPNPNYPASGYLRTGTNPIADPLAYIPAVNASSLPIQTVPAPVNKVYTLSPGRYVGGLKFTGNEDVIMQPGIYYMDGGGFTFAGPGSLTGNTVMIYNGGTNPGSVTIQGNGAVTLGPLPESFALAQGLTIFQDRSSTNTVTIKHLGSQNEYYITGAIYAANALVYVRRQGNDNRSVGSQFISRMLQLEGTNNMTISGGYVYTRTIGGVE
jgi:Flp pilus assembly protein TadG